MTITGFLTLAFHLISFAQNEDPWTMRQMQKFEGDRVDIVIFDSKDAEPILKRFDSTTLLQLTNHSNAGVRCHAFMALIRQNHSEVKNIFFSHLQDTAKVMTTMAESCLFIKMTVGEFMMNELHPVGSKNDFRLSREEYNFFSNQIRN